MDLVALLLSCSQPKEKSSHYRRRQSNNKSSEPHTALDIALQRGPQNTRYYTNRDSGHNDPKYSRTIRALDDMDAPTLRRFSTVNDLVVPPLWESW